MQYYYGTLSGMFSAEKRREYTSKYLEGVIIGLKHKK
jgi:hypothetical protein